MRRNTIWIVAALCVLFAATTSRAELGFRLGAGAHYVRTVGEIKDTPEFDADAFNLVGAGKLGLGLVNFELDVEWLPDYGGSSEALWLPEAFVLVGGLIYGGAGIGTGYIDGEWFDDPFYALRAGIDFPIGPVSLDINANYRFMDTSVFDEVDNEDFDSITLGAIVRIGL